VAEHLIARSAKCKFLSYAKASLDETKNHVYDGHESGYFSEQERDRLISLLKRTIGGINRLIALP